MSIREGESEREALLRMLGAPRPPVLHSGRDAEQPEQRRQRYLRSNRRDVSDPDLWFFLHGATVGSESSNYEEEVESEEVSDDGYSLVTEEAQGPHPEAEEKPEFFCFEVKVTTNFTHDRRSWGECDGVGNPFGCTAFIPFQNREV